MLCTKPRRAGLWMAYSILSSVCQICPTISPSPLLSVQALGFLGCPSLGLVAPTGWHALAFALCYVASRKSRGAPSSRKRAVRSLGEGDVAAPSPTEFLR